MRTLLLGDIGNRLDIADTEDDIRRLRRQQLSSNRTLNAKNLKISELQDEIDELKLATQALTRFLIVKGVVNDSELEEFITAVDAEDGVVDGKISTSAQSTNPRLAHKSKKPFIPEGTFKKPDAPDTYSLDE